MIALEITLVEAADEDVSGFALGHMSLRGERGACDSRELGGRGAMMVFPTLVEMLDGVRVVLSEEKDEHELVGTGSAWIVRFSRSKSGITIRCGAQIIDEVDGTSIRRALLDGVHQFAGPDVSLLCTSDPVRVDLVRAMQRFVARR